MYYSRDFKMSLQEIYNHVDLIKGSVNRICVTDDISEIISMLKSANVNLSAIALSRINSLLEDNYDKK